jgi:hypothetical protein
LSLIPDNINWIICLDLLQQQLQLKSQNANHIQDELDDVKTKSMAEEATTLDKPKGALVDIRYLQDANKHLSQIIRDVEIGREATDRERQVLAARSQNLERDLERTKQDYRELVAHNECLNEENLSVLQQIKDATKKGKRNLQLIQDLEQEIRRNVKRRSEADLASVGRPETLMAALVGRMDMNGMSDQVGRRSDVPESSPGVHRPGIMVDMSTEHLPSTETPGRRRSGRSAAGGNKRRTMRMNTRDNKRRTRESPPASSNAPVSDD